MEKPTDRQSIKHLDIVKRLISYDWFPLLRDSFIKMADAPNYFAHVVQDLTKRTI